MKRKIAICIFLMLVITIIPMALNTAIAHTADDPLVVDLIAGGGHGQENGNGNDGEDAGDVLVWNDEDTLYIKYVSHDPWVITETHLHVALSMGAIPQKNGNPIPGQFENNDEWDPARTEVTYTYDLGDWGWTPGTDLYLAAHAVVMNISCYDTGVVYGIQRYTGDVYGVDVLAGTSSLEFTIPIGGTSASPNGLAYNSINGYFYYTDYQLGTTPDTLYFWDGTSQTVAGQVAYGTIACGDISDGKYYYIPTSTDDLYEIIFNPDGTIATDTKLGDISGDAHSWTFDGDIAVKDGVVYGWGHDSHGYEYFTYDLATTSFFLIKPTYQSSLQLAFGSNGELYGHRSGGAGAFYEIDITNGEVTLISEPGVLFTDCASGEICVPTTETAWGHGFEFAGKNWATYFEYTIQEEADEWVLFDTFTVPATTGTPTLSNEVLESGALYKIEVIGTYFFRTAEDPSGYLADAEWAERFDAYGTGWVKGDAPPYSDPYNGLDLCFDALTNTDWGDLDEDTHTYSIEYTGTGSQISLFIKDSYYGDNSGYLTVNIYEWA